MLLIYSTYHAFSKLAKTEHRKNGLWLECPKETTILGITQGSRILENKRAARLQLKLYGSSNK